MEFLQAGLKHSLLSTRLQEFLDFESPSSEIGSAPKDPEKLKQAKQAMRELIRFRHDPKNLFVSDYISNATVEKNQIINIETLFDGKGTSKELTLKTVPFERFDRPTGSLRFADLRLTRYRLTAKYWYPQSNLTDLVERVATGHAHFDAKSFALVVTAVTFESSMPAVSTAGMIARASPNFSNEPTFR